MDYKEALNYILNIGRSGSDYGIERMRYLLDILGSPDKSLKFVHVAGTNGKGSVCAYLTSVFKESGLRVGTYNSPSVFSYNERWSYLGKPISDEAVAKYLTEVRCAIDSENARRNARGDVFQNDPVKDGAFAPTAFEIETAVAMLAFKDMNCDIVVLETGLGGRWDATNAITQKEIAVIVPIGLDHCALLGNTLAQIAQEKAAIIRGNAVTCKQCDEVMQCLLNPYDIADGKKVPLPVNLTVSKQPALLSRDMHTQTFDYDGRIYEISLLGRHQLQNASIAIAAVDVLRNCGWAISEDALKSGLKNAVWHARFEIISDGSRFGICIPSGKTLVFDGAHNPHGAAALKEAIEDYFNGKRIHAVMGILGDKDVDGVVSLLAPLFEKATAITPESPRALDKNELSKKIRKYTDCDVCDSVRLALQNALDSDCDVVILCGSLTLFEQLGRIYG